MVGECPFVWVCALSVQRMAKIGPLGIAPQLFKVALLGNNNCVDFLLRPAYREGTSF